MFATLAAGLLISTLGSAPASSARDPARIQVVATEFELLPSRYVLPAGPAIVELVNSGEDPHDLALRRIAPVARTIRMKAVQPGGLTRLRVTLHKGRYFVWCTVADHRALGMQAWLTVR